MARILFNTVVLVLFNYAFSQDRVETKSDASSDPVSVLLKELGYLILDVDQAYSEVSAPKVELEDEVKEQMYGRPRSEYFNRIRENYKRIQRMGSLGFNDLSFSSNILGVNVKNEGQSSAVDVSVPSLPLKLQVRSKVPTVNNADSDITGRSTAKAPESRFASKLKVGDSEIKIDSAFPFVDTLSRIAETEKLQESNSKISDVSEGFIAKPPESRFASKLKLGSSEMKLNSAFGLPDAPSETKLTRRSQETGSKLFDSVEDFTRTTPESRLASKIKVGNSQINADLEFVPQETLPEIELLDELVAGHLIVLGDLGEGEKRWKRRTPLVEKADEELVSLFTKTYNEYLFSDKWAIDFKPSDIYTGVSVARGRVLGDFLFSESTFDKLTKETIQNSKWVLDSDLSPYKVFKKLEEIGKSVFSRRRRETKVLSETSSFEPNSDLNKNAESEFPPIAAPVESGSDSADPGSLDVSDEGSYSDEVGTQHSDGDQVEAEPPKETTLLAFTNNGVPVKLRMGPEIKRPYRFLHTILSSAQVTLSVQMIGNDDTDPPEKAFQLPTPSLLVDLSDEKQRYAFLRTLREFKNQELSQKSKRSATKLIQSEE